MASGTVLGTLFLTGPVGIDEVGVRRWKRRRPGIWKRADAISAIGATILTPCGVVSHGWRRR